MEQSNKNLITKKEFWGNPPDLIFWSFVIFGSPLLMLYSLDHYPFVNQNSPTIWQVPLCAYLVGVVVFFIRRKKLFPWGAKVRVMEILSIISMPILWAMLALAIFIFLNANLDKSTPQNNIHAGYFGCPWIEKKSIR